MSNVLLFQGCASAEEFMEKLPQYDEDLAKERLEAENSGEVKDLFTINFIQFHVILNPAKDLSLLISGSEICWSGGRSKPKGNSRATKIQERPSICTAGRFRQHNSIHNDKVQGSSTYCPRTWCWCSSHGRWYIQRHTKTRILSGCTVLTG